ncbi:transposase [Sphingomonas oligophenolica]|uniref:Transposase n=2 Tax=Sphingomonas oligophenolica TaxID=301154 RepID=A0ABU9YCZ9_9SPHN
MSDQLAGLEAAVATLTAQNAALRAENGALKEEIARLKGLPPRPKFTLKPSGMEQATSKPAGKKGRKRGRGAVRDKLVVTSEVRLKAQVPQGSRFKGYEDVLVQDLRISVAVVRYRRERWETPSGERIVAALPPGILGGFGPELRRFIAAGHYQGQVTSDRLTALLCGMGLHISKRQVVRLLSKGLEALVAEDEAVLRTGLETARWISVDDTSARHAGKNGFVTQLGDDRFAVFRTTMSKSRRSFLSLLRAGRTDYVVNDAALAMMRRLAMPAPLVARLARRRARRFADEAAWLAHLEALGFDRLKVTPDPIKVATEGALWGALCEQGLLEGTVIVSDGARQFGVGDHALCWVHAERLVYKLQPSNPADRRAVEIQRALIWWFYADLKAYKRNPDPKHARMMRARFDRIFTRKTGYIMLDRQLAHLHRNKEALLRVLDRPEIPLHTNGSENDIRTVVTKRKISGGTVSEQGKIARDTMLGLMKTCAKLGVSYYRFLGDRFAITGANAVPTLPSLVKLASA